MRKLLYTTAAFFMTTAVAYAAPITVTGSYNITETGSATISNVLGDPFSLNLTVGTPSAAITRTPYTSWPVNPQSP